MKVVTNGREHSLKLKKNNRQISGLQEEALELVKEVFPLREIYTEVPIPGLHLFIDILIPSAMLVVEVHGEQHYKYNKHFHGDKLKYAESQGRDNTKKEWCETNGFVFVELPFNNKELWKQKLMKAFDE